MNAFSLYPGHTVGSTVVYILIWNLDLYIVLEKAVKKNTTCFPALPSGPFLVRQSWGAVCSCCGLETMYRELGSILLLLQNQGSPWINPFFPLGLSLPILWWQLCRCFRVIKQRPKVWKRCPDLPAMPEEPRAGWKSGQVSKKGTGCWQGTWVPLKTQTLPAQDGISTGPASQSSQCPFCLQPGDILDYLPALALPSCH